MSKVRLLSFSYKFVITKEDEKNESKNDGGLEESVLKLSMLGLEPDTQGVQLKQNVGIPAVQTRLLAPTPVPPTYKSSRGSSEGSFISNNSTRSDKKQTLWREKGNASCSSVQSLSDGKVTLNDMERVVQVVFKVYYPENREGNQRKISIEVNNKTQMSDLLQLIVQQCSPLKKMKQVTGRLFYTQRKFRHPAELDSREYSRAMVEDLAESGKNLHFVFDTAGKFSSEVISTSHQIIYPWTVIQN